MMHPIPFLTLATFHLAPLALGALDCSKILVDNVKFDISTLKGAHSVVDIDDDSTGQATNTTYTFDLCAPLKRDSDQRGGCMQGAWACAFERPYDKDADTKKPPEATKVWSIAGDFIHNNGGALDSKYQRLKGSSAHEDSDIEGLRITYNGGTRAHGTKTAMIAELICDRGSNETDKDEKRADDDDDKKEEPAEKGLEFVDYKAQPIPGNKKGELQEVLRLKWTTKYACEDQAGKPGPANGNGHWGFFTWFIIILFLIIATYLIFGSWLNYNRHGARGWDLLPHGDTIRDVPYLLKDFGRRIVDTVQGGQTSQGYNRI